jgi:hypothetical protein
MDEGEEDAEAALQPYWFEQEISANYFAWRTCNWTIEKSL